MKRIAWICCMFSLLAVTQVRGADTINNLDPTTIIYTKSDVDSLVAGYQPLQANLTGISALTLAANKMPYMNATPAWATADLTAAGRNLLDDADAAAQRATLSLTIGTDVQAWDTDLDALATVSNTSFGRGFLSLATSTAGRTYLGLGTAATQPTSAFATASHTHDATEIVSGSLDGDRLAAPTTTKRGGVAATGTPSGKFLRDDDTWASPSAGGISDGDYGDITVSGTGATWTVDSGAVAESELSFSDITTNNVSTSAHGFTPKAPNDATKFLDGTAAWDTVKDSDLSTSDITTNDVTTSKHGFVPKAPNDTTKFLRGDAAWAVPSFPGRIHKVSVINVGTTSFTPDAATTMMMVECWGAGGGGGGADGGSSQSGCGAGGGGGGYRVAFVTTMRSGYTTSIPNGGTGGTAGNNAGNTASDTTFIDTAGSGANCSITADGGYGGGSMAAGTTVVRATPGSGGSAGSSSGSDIAWSTGMTGSYGGAGLRFSATICISGDGGGATRSWGSDARSVNGSTVGESAGWACAGGSGGAANSTTDRAGGSGSGGLIIVTEYK